MAFYSCDNEYLNYCHCILPLPHQNKPCFQSQFNKYCLFSRILSPYMAVVPKMCSQECFGNMAFCDRLPGFLLWLTETRGSKKVSYDFRGLFLLQMSHSRDRSFDRRCQSKFIDQLQRHPPSQSNCRREFLSCWMLHEYNQITRFRNFRKKQTMPLVSPKMSSFWYNTNVQHLVHKRQMFTSILSQIN